ncbi:MAG TPA: lysine 5,6-aminomutase subunit alpha, partial [Sedimentibacter sp.]|nr:lysine 5,6-aminomutase subunit alpha [Sedimentibacter sp.]
MESKLNLNPHLIESARIAARNIADDVQKFIDKNTTVTVERTIARLMGVDGVDEIEKPLPNVLIDSIKEGGGLSRGAAFWIGNAMVNTGKTPQEIAEKVSSGEIEITRLPIADENKIMEAVYETAKQMVKKIKNSRAKRDEYLKKLGEGRKPYLYVIVATGNIYEDVLQAQAAAKQGADVIAVIRTTAQSLLDYVPYGPTTEGFGGTYATQENFRIMRKALDEVGEEVGRYIRLCNYCSGLCMPEIAAMGAIERLDVMLNDALYGILFRD